VVLQDILLLLFLGNILTETDTQERLGQLHIFAYSCPTSWDDELTHKKTTFNLHRFDFPVKKWLFRLGYATIQDFRL
jgi:hypothetical protein